MFALEAPLLARLQALPALAGWDVRSGIAEMSRTAVPAVEVRLDGARLADQRMSAANVTALWRVDLIHTRSAAAMEALDTAFAAVLGSLHNWAPGSVAGRAWQPVRLAAVQPPEFAEQGLVAYSLIFETAARYDGQP